MEPFAVRILTIRTCRSGYQQLIEYQRFALDQFSHLIFLELKM